MNPRSKCKLGSLKKVKNEYLFQIVRRKSCDCILIIYMKKYEIAYYNYAEAKCTHQVQKWFILTLQVTLCVWSKQPCTIKTIIYDIFTSLRCKWVQSLAKQYKELFSLVNSLHWINPLLHWITWKLHLS